MPLPLLVFPVILLSTFPHRIKAYSLLQTYPTLQSRTCNSPILPPKGLKILDLSIHLRRHFSIRRHHKCALQTKLRILIYLQDQYLSTTSDVTLSPTQSPNVKVLFKCDMSVESRTRIATVEDRGFTSTLQD